MSNARTFSNSISSIHPQSKMDPFLAKHIVLNEQHRLKNNGTKKNVVILDLFKDYDPI